jgi:exosortase/archaeosortase family protein
MRSGSGRVGNSRRELSTEPGFSGLRVRPASGGWQAGSLPRFSVGLVRTLRNWLRRRRAEPTVIIEVADECSGIGSSIALLLTGLLAGHLYLDGVWKKVIIAAAILPITIVKNAIRIVTLSLLSIHVDPSFLTGQLHHERGVVFFALALLILVPLFAVLRNAGRNRRTEAAQS